MRKKSWTPTRNPLPITISDGKTSDDDYGGDHFGGSASGGELCQKLYWRIIKIKCTHTHKCRQAAAATFNCAIQLYKRNDDNCCRFVTFALKLLKLAYAVNLLPIHTSFTPIVNSRDPGSRTNHSDSEGKNFWLPKTINVSSLMFSKSRRLSFGWLAKG